MDPDSSDHTEPVHTHPPPPLINNIRTEFPSLQENMDKYLPGMQARFLKCFIAQKNLEKIPWAEDVYEHMLFNTEEDKPYWEKYKHMETYLEPLQCMIASVDVDETDKIRQLLNATLEILCNPNRELSLEQLDDFIQILERIVEFYNNNQLEEDADLILASIKASLESPLASHTIQRTFKPYWEQFFGSNISAHKPVNPSDVCPKEPPQEIPHIVQREIAQLNQKFKVSLDTSAPSNAKTIQLICCLDDELLPCVPPINVVLPEEYPFVAPNCSLQGQDYLATPFLLAVKNVLTSKIANLPKCYSLSRLLDVWEMSVRHVCSPNAVTVYDLDTIFGM